MSDPIDITPEGSSATVFLDETPLPPSNNPSPFEEANAQFLLKEEAKQKLMHDFGFTEEMAKAVVGL